MPRYRHPLNINVGMIIFAIIFVYMAFSVYTYAKKEKVQFYNSYHLWTPVGIKLSFDSF